ncbi:MAG: RecX family transcriptional regulator [Clostridia bacterium]|nr:RecX family transcriptional regulator [Clostridia bacterium]
MRIEIVSVSAGGEDEVFVSVEMCDGVHSDRVKLLVPSSAYVDMGLRSGECSQELFECLEYESRVYAAYKRALSVLSFGACSERMLVSKLVAKGFERVIALEAVQRVSLRGFLSEKDGAEREAERCAAKLWGPVRIRAHLGSRGYGKDAIDGAMFSLEDAGIDYIESCQRLIESKYKRLPSDRAELQKLIAAVCRYGYSLSDVKSACAKIASKKESLYDQ